MQGELVAMHKLNCKSLSINDDKLLVDLTEVTSLRFTVESSLVNSSPRLT